MQYMLLIYDDENVWSSLSEDERNRAMDEYRACTDDVLVFTAPAHAS